MTLIFYMKATAVFLRIFIGLFFILSGWIKLYPIEYFENDLLLNNLSKDTFVVYSARLLVSVEIILGALMCLFIYKKWIDILSILMLLFYSLWLVFLLTFQGNEGNCGCLGNWVALTPLEGLLKNIALLIPLIFFFNKPAPVFKFRPALLSMIIIIAGIAIPYIVAPPIFSNANLGDPSKAYYPDYSLVTQDSSVIQRLRKEKKIVAFFLGNCEHCKLAATRLEAIYKEQPTLPVHAFIYGDDALINDFIQESRMTFPYTPITELAPVIKVAGNDFPAIQLLENGRMVQLRSLYDIKSDELNNWLISKTNAE